MKQYVLSIYQPDGGTPSPEVLETIMRDVRALNDEMQAAGVWVMNAGLEPARRAKVVRLKEGASDITDGPYTEAKEHVGGFIVLRACDLDEALAWARKYARAIALPIEVRAVQGA
jgi:hypothetical protein